MNAVSKISTHAASLISCNNGPKKLESGWRATCASPPRAWGAASRIANAPHGRQRSVPALHGELGVGPPGLVPFAWNHPRISSSCRIPVEAKKSKLDANASDMIMLHMTCIRHESMETK